MSVFLPKKKKTPGGQSRVTSARTARPIVNGGPSSQSGPSRPPTAASSPAGGLASGLSSDSPSEDHPPGYDPAKAIELPLFSSGDLNGTRYNIMRMNAAQDVDPRHIPSPILMNRKPRGGPTMPTLATDEEGNVVGKYVYDHEGKPVLDAEGQHVVERTVSRDHNLVGGATAQKKRRGKAVREVYHADIEAVKLRREEADPWVLESGRPKTDNANGVKSEAGPSGVKMEIGRAAEDQHKIADRWVGTMLQPSNMATVLLLDSGAGGFNVVPLGRTYKFDPARPFTPLDPDAAQKAFEYQTKHKFQNRWEYRQGGPTTAADAVNRYSVIRQEARAQRLEQHMRLANGAERKPIIKTERFEDDAKREGRQMERGMEGGEDEELDYDFNEDFQDDDDNNTFHRNEEEEEEQKRIEERLKKEFKLANATVGDRPQIEETEDSDEDLFGEKLNDQGKRLRRMMRKRGERPDDFYGTDSDTDTDTDTETVKSEKSVDKSKEEKEAEAAKSVPGSAERPSRPASRGPPSHRGSSPAPHRGTPPPSGNAQAAPPGAGAAFVARRATGGAASPRRHRTGSPLGRAQSPETGSVRGSSPVSVRGASPAPGREGSPVSVPPARPVKGGPTGKIPRKTPTASPQPAGTPSASGNAPSPGPSNANKRKTSPGDDASRPKKTKRPGSSTPTPQPEEVEPFPGMITRQEVHKWFKSQNKEVVPMGEVIAAFKHRIGSTPKEKMGVNQKLFLGHVKGMTRQEENKMLRFQG